MGLKKRGLESKFVVILIIALIACVIFIFMRGTMYGWIQAMIDKLFVI
jgi:hypothetical protein